MTLTMVCTIVFHANNRREEIILNKVNEIYFESTFKNISDKGTLTLPRKVKFFDKNNVRDVFRKGDALTVLFGYNNDFVEEFSGYVSKVSADLPIQIDFEDEMYKVKRLPVNFSSPNITLEALFKEVVPGYELDILEDVALGPVVLEDTQVGSVLEKLQQDFGLYTYMVGKKVVCGKYYADDSQEEAIIFNLERDCVSTALNYKAKEDVLIRIRAVSTFNNGEKLEIDGIGDADGNERKLIFFNITLKAELERLARSEYEKYKVDKMEGYFTAFGIPSVRHGLKCQLISELYKDREGVYYIEGVKKTFGIGGIRQEVQLGNKV